MLRYKVDQGEDGKWYATIWSSSDQIWRTGDGYNDKDGAMRAVEILVEHGLFITNWGL